MADAEIRAIHENAVEAASEDDQDWFRNNPSRHYRIRDLMPYEFNQKIDPPKMGHTWRTITAQVKEGVRMRQPVSLPEGLQNEGADDEVLARIFDQVAPEQFKDAMTQISQTMENKS